MGRFNSLELDAKPAVSGAKQTAVKPSGEFIRDAAFYLQEADELCLQREFEPALRSYSKALEIDPGCAEAWHGQISCLIALEELHEAAMWAKKAVEIVGESQELLALQARIYCRRGDFDRAYGMSDASMQAPGNSPLVWSVRGEIMLYSTNKQSEHCFDKALAAANGDCAVIMDIAGCCIYAGKYTMAFKYLKPALESNPEIASLWMCAADCHRHFGHQRKALECMNTAMELAPDCARYKKSCKEIAGESSLKNWFRRWFYWN